MNRRELTGSLLALAGIAASLQLKAQATKGEVARGQQVNSAARVGFLAMGQHPAFPVFVQSLNSLGWVEGRNVMLEPRFAEVGKPEQFDQLAVDLVRHGVDVIVALIRTEIFAARRAPTKISIVKDIGEGPVGNGRVQ